MISIGLKNPPTNAYYWKPIFYVGVTPIYPSDYLGLNERWVVDATPFIGLQIDFRAVVYYSNKSILDTRDLFNLYIADNHYYTYDWTANEWEDISPILGWLLVAEKTISVGRIPTIVGWTLVAEKTISVGRIPTIVGWVLVAEKTISVGRIPTVGGWLLVAEKELIVRRAGVPVPPPEPPTPEEKEFPWLPVALIGVGAVVVVATVEKPKKAKT